MNGLTQKSLSMFMMALLTSCGGGSQNNTNSPLLELPQNVQLVTGNGKVTLSWDGTNDNVQYDICTATETIVEPDSCASHQNGVLTLDVSSPIEIDSLSNNTPYFFVIIASNASSASVLSSVFTATPFNPVAPSPTGKLNDTGMTSCGDFAFALNSSLIHNNGADCSLSVEIDAGENPIPGNQDAVFGRDADPLLNSDDDGHSGFSFIKINSQGEALADQTVGDFNCVKDNVTGLVWEVKQTAAGLHNKEDTYTWFNNISPENNGGSFGDNSAVLDCEGITGNDSCNTQSYSSRVNDNKLCGASDWRLPTVKELLSLVTYDRGTATIDTDYFPQTETARTRKYWTSVPYAPHKFFVWTVNFAHTDENSGNHAAPEAKTSTHYIRLVRDGL